MDKVQRVLYLWRCEVEEQRHCAEDLKRRNEALVYNILPSHVATHFMGNRNRNHDELYSQSYEEVGVLFASMPNFSGLRSGWRSCKLLTFVPFFRLLLRRDCQQSRPRMSTFPQRSHFGFWRCKCKGPKRVLGPKRVCYCCCSFWNFRSTTI